MGGALRRRGGWLGSILMLIGAAFLVFFTLAYLGAMSAALTLDLALLPVMVIWQFMTGLRVLKGGI